MLQTVSAAIAKAAPGSTVKVALRRAGLAVSVICETTGEALIRDDVPTAIAAAFEGDAARLPASAGSDSLSATGLALALTHSLAKLSGATLTVANTGTGCRFALLFPIEAGSGRAGAAAA